jgi:hypothetical protein
MDNRQRSLNYFFPQLPFGTMAHTPLSDLPDWVMTGGRPGEGVATPYDAAQADMLRADLLRRQQALQQQQEPQAVDPAIARVGPSPSDADLFRMVTQARRR